MLSRRQHGKIGLSFFLRYISPKAYLLDRVHRTYGRYKDRFSSFGIQEISERGVFEEFMRGYSGVGRGKFRTSFIKAGGESPIGVGIVKGALNFRAPVFSAAFTLTPSLEKAPAERGAFDLAILSLQGPSPRKTDSRKAAQAVEGAFGEPGKNVLLKEMTRLGREKGARGIAFLRPEHDPYLTNEFLASKGLSAEEAESIRSQHYAAARKAGFRKKKGSMFFWHSTG